jgi:hypothetical protein
MSETTTISKVQKPFPTLPIELVYYIFEILATAHLQSALALVLVSKDIQQM